MVQNAWCRNVLRQQSTSVSDRNTKVTVQAGNALPDPVENRATANGRPGWGPPHGGPSTAHFANQESPAEIQVRVSARRVQLLVIRPPGFLLLYAAPGKCKEPARTKTPPRRPGRAKERPIGEKPDHFPGFQVARNAVTGTLRRLVG